jgi:hypothetical protein
MRARRNSPNWTEREIETLREWAKTHDTWDGVPVDRLIRNVKEKARKLRICLTGNKNNRYANKWLPWEDRLALAGRKKAMKGREIHDLYLPWRTTTAINLRINKLNGEAYKEVKKDIYMVDANPLKRLFFTMPEVFKVNKEWGLQGAATNEIHGHIC